METWLVDIKQLRIPRPKFGGSTSPQRGRNPREPPRDYNTNDDMPSATDRNLKHQTDTEDLRQALQEKL